MAYTQDRDNFVRKYIYENPTKSKTEALQEYNREKSKRSEYIEGFSGNTSLSRLPPDAQRNILSQVPGGRYSVATAKQGARPDRLAINVRELCDSPISVGEFKKYIYRIIEEVRDGKRKYLDVSFVAGYEIASSDPNTDDEARKRFRRHYFGDRRFPTLLRLYYDGTYVSYYVIITEINEDGELSYVILDDSDGLDAVLEKMLDDNNFEDAPNVIPNILTAIEIFEQRGSCKGIDLEEFLERGYNYKRLLTDFLAPLYPDLSTNSKSELINKLFNTNSKDKRIDFVKKYIIQEKTRINAMPRSIESEVARFKASLGQKANEEEDEEQ